MQFSHLIRFGAAEVYLYRRPTEPVLWNLIRESDPAGRGWNALLSLGRTRVIVSTARPAADHL